MVYAILQVAYNAKLKHVVIWDVGAIAMGFVIRACAGAAATGISLSPWFTLCTGMLALFLGIEKRKAELLLVERSGYKGRRVLSHYSRGLLARMESTVTTGTLMGVLVVERWTGREWRANGLDDADDSIRTIRHFSLSAS